MSGCKGAPHWTEERIALMRRLRAQGVASSKIAAALSMTGHHFTRNAVIAKCDRLGLCKVSADRTKRTVRAARPTQRIFPKVKAEPFTRSKAPPKREDAIQWLQHDRGECEMFCVGEELATGFVCGKPTLPGQAWCEACRGIVYIPGSAFSRRAA